MHIYKCIIPNHLSFDQSDFVSKIFIDSFNRMTNIYNNLATLKSLRGTASFNLFTNTLVHSQVGNSYGRLCANTFRYCISDSVDEYLSYSAISAECINGVDIS